MSVEDKATQLQYGEIINWIRESTRQGWQEKAKEDFLDSADPWLIAKAKIMGVVVVTQEKSAPTSRRKIFIPDICREFSVGCVNVVEMFRREQARF